MKAGTAALVAVGVLAGGAVLAVALRRRGDAGGEAGVASAGAALLPLDAAAVAAALAPVAPVAAAPAMVSAVPGVTSTGTRVSTAKNVGTPFWRRTDFKLPSSLALFPKKGAPGGATVPEAEAEAEAAEVVEVVAPVVPAAVVSPAARRLTELRALRGRSVL